MAREGRRGSRCSNSWRPSDRHLSSEVRCFQQHQSPVTIERSERSLNEDIPHPSTRQYSNIDRRMTSHSVQVSPEPSIERFKNPNLVPVVPRYSQARPPSYVGDIQQHEEIADRRLPQVWNPSIDDLMRRTAHDYDLVMNYERDAEGGQRWTSEDIVCIRDIGKDLHRDIFALKRWQRVVAQQGDQDRTIMMHIKREANFLKLLCERVQRAIVKYEQQCEFELLRNGVYAQDENGNFYRPVAPQESVTEGDCLRNLPRPSTEDVEGDSWAHRQDHNHEQDRSGIVRRKTLVKYKTSSPSPRSVASDFAFQPAPFDGLKREVAHQQSEPARQAKTSHSGIVMDGKVSKPCAVPYWSELLQERRCIVFALDCEALC